MEPVKRYDWAGPVAVWKMNQWANVPALWAGRLANFKLENIFYFNRKYWNIGPKCVGPPGICPVGQITSPGLGVAIYRY